MNLKDFIKESKNSTYGKNAYVIEPGFEKLYVRFGRRYIEEVWYNDVLDIASVVAENPGQGAFTRLINQLKIDYPEMIIYVENVHNLKFRKKLLKMGFIQNGISFYLK